MQTVYSSSSSDESEVLRFGPIHTAPMIDSTPPTPLHSIPLQSTYADDDSAVSSAVTPDPLESQQLVRSSPQPKAGILPRNKREWCIVLFATFAVVAVAAAVGLGVGLLTSRSPDSPRSIEDTADDTDAPTSSPTDRFATALEYHIIHQAISTLSSFAEYTGAESSNATAQLLARDFLISRDILPTSLADEANETATATSTPYLNTDAPAYRVVQRYAMIALFYATEGEGWESGGWVEPGVSECEWVGVVCEEVEIPGITLLEAVEAKEIPEHDDGGVEGTVEWMVVEINLPENNLRGYLPGEIGALPFLRVLGLWSNGIGGGVPSEIGELTRMESLHLDDNDFTGTIPTQIGGLREMRDLSFAANDGMRGEIPSEIVKLGKLERLWLYGMQLEGSIPKITETSMENLKDLNIRNNNIGGPLPDGIKHLIHLESLVLSSNRFTGSVPTSWSSMANLKRFELSNNKIRGKIPNFFDNFPNLETIALDVNSLIGSIPPSIGSAGTSMTRITLGENKLDGQIPDGIQHCTNLKQLELNSNQLRGSMPSWIGALTKLEYLDLSDNMLSGDVPSELSELTNIRELRMEKNSLGGTVPCDFPQASVISADCSPRGGTVTCSCCTRCT